MLNVGDLIPINGRQALVCFTSEYKDRHYINVCFEDNDEYKVYEVKLVDQDLDLKAVTDVELLKSLSAIWVAQELEGFEANQ